jgi:hypothetical protein
MAPVQPATGYGGIHEPRGCELDDGILVLADPMLATIRSTIGSTAIVAVSSTKWGLLQVS